jgi:hypothetical protein
VAGERLRADSPFDLTFFAIVLIIVATIFPFPLVGKVARSAGWGWMSRFRARELRKNMTPQEVKL